MAEPDDDSDRHLWVRMGGPTFCGKRGCGLLMTEAAINASCRGEESGGIKLLRSTGKPSAKAEGT